MKKRLLIFIFIITVIIGITIPAYAERIKYSGVARTSTGTVLGTATVSTYLAGTTTPAGVYTASSGGAAVYSVTSDTGGRFTFYVDTADYGFVQQFKVVATKDGYETVSLDNIYELQLPTDAAGYLVNDGSGNLSWSSSLSSGGITFDSTPDASGEIGYASNHFNWFANSEDFVITAAANLWTFSSNTDATFAFTPSVTFTGGASLGGTLAVGANNLTMTGSLGATGSRVTKGWFTDIESTNAPSVNGVAANASLGLMTNLMTTAGDVLYGGASGANTRLGIGTAYQVFHTNSGATAPAWTSTLGATGTRLTKGWFTDLESTNIPTVGGTALLSSLTAPVFSTSIEAPFLVLGSAATAADAGTIRMPNAGSIMFEADGAGTDINALSVDSSEVVQIGSTGASGVTITPNTTLSGTGTLSKVNAAGGSADALTLSGTLGIMNGSDTFRGIYLNYTNAASHSATDYVNGIAIGNLVGTDAQETGIYIGSGWDAGIDIRSPMLIKGVAGSTKGYFYLYDSQAVPEYVGFTPADETTSYTLILPAAAPGAASFPKVSPDGTTVWAAEGDYAKSTDLASYIATSIITDAGVVVGTADSTPAFIAKGANNTIFGVSNEGILGFHAKLSEMLDEAPASGSYSGTGITLVAGESIAQGSVVYCKVATSAHKCYKYDANGADKAKPARYLYVGSSTLSDGDSGTFLVRGTFKLDSWSWITDAQDEGKVIYASAATAGAMTVTAPSTAQDMVQILGYVLELDTIHFDPCPILVEVP